MGDETERTLFGVIPVTLNERVPPGEIWLVGPWRPASGQAREYVRIVGIEAAPGTLPASAASASERANGGSDAN